MTAAARSMPGLDGLRALACLMVFLVHFGQKTALQGHWGPFDLARLLANGNTGVALFFSLSGFLLSLPHWSSMRDAQPLPGVSRFYLLRLARVAPAFYGCLAALVVGNQLWLEVGWQRDVGLHGLFLFNLTEHTTLSINPAFWTMAVEVQFYLLMPWLFRLLRGSDVRRAAIANAVLAALAYLAHATLVELAVLPTVVTTYSLLAHLPHFLMGVATAGLLSARRTAPEGGGDRHGLLGLAATLLLLVILGTPLGDWLQLPYGRYHLPVVPALLCLLIVLAAQRRPGWRLLETRPLQAIGTVSYGIYLCHLPVLNVVARQLPALGLDPRQHWALYGLSSLALTLAVATLSYLVVERRVLRAARRWLDRPRVVSGPP